MLLGALAASQAAALPATEFVADVTTLAAVRMIQPAAEPAFTIDLAPAVWAARVRGETALGASNISVDDTLGLNGYEAAFNGELAISWGGFWRVQLNGWTFSTDASVSSSAAGTFGSVDISVGDQVSSSFAAASAGAEFDATLWRPFSAQPFPWSDRSATAGPLASDGRPVLDFAIKAIGAVRWYGANMSLSNQTDGTSASWSLNAVMPGIGGGIDLDFNMVDRVSWLRSVRFEAAGGTGTNFTSGQYFVFARAGLRAMFTANVGAEFGYRLEDFKLAGNGASFDGGVAGLFVGIDVRF